MKHFRNILRVLDRQIFLYVISKAKSLRERKVITLDFIKIRNFWAANCTIKKVIKIKTIGENICK